MAIPTIAPFSSSSSDPFVARWILDENATRHVCNELNMFDDDNKATVWVVFPSANKHDIKLMPRRLTNVFYDPHLKSTYLRSKLRNESTQLSKFGRIEGFIRTVLGLDRSRGGTESLLDMAFHKDTA
jgi:hypothetical protein